MKLESTIQEFHKFLTSLRYPVGFSGRMIKMENPG